MCAISSPASGLGETLAKLSPHRLLGLPSYIDPLLHPNSKYNRAPDAAPDPSMATRSTISTETETDVPMDEWKRRARQNIAMPNLMASMSSQAKAPIKIGAQ